MSKYYKILPENMCCLGFQYQEGLNIDTNKVDKERFGYGLHFANAKGILSYCNYGTMIAEVEIPKDAVVFHFGNKFKADRIILKNLRPLLNIETLKELKQEGVRFTRHMNFLLYRAATLGHLGVVKYLVEQGANIHALDDDALCYASKNGHFDIVKYLVEHGANIHAGDDGALRWASRNGYFDIVKYLVEHGADIHAWFDYAICWAKTPEILEYLGSVI